MGAKGDNPDLDRWFANCGGFEPAHDLEILREGVAAGYVDSQDQYGMTALSLAVTSNWIEGVAELLRADADTELRYFRTGATALYLAAQQTGNQAIASLLVSAGADPDAPNYWGVTPRRWLPAAFEGIPIRETPLPEPLIQNAEHLAEHHHPRFKIPSLKERASLRAGQAVTLYVYGPKSELKQDTIKVRIVSRFGQGRNTRYVGAVETPVERTHLLPGTDRLEFAPENIATVYVTRPSKED
jgi:hypothetical protein